MYTAADSLGGFIAVHDGHLDIHQDSIEAALCRSSEKLCALQTVFNDRDCRTRFFQNQFGDLLIDRMIFCQQKRFP